MTRRFWERSRSAIHGTATGAGAALRSERLDLVRAAGPGDLTGAARGAYLERVHDLYLDKTLGDKNAALMALRGAIEADPTTCGSMRKALNCIFSSARTRSPLASTPPSRSSKARSPPSKSAWSSHLKIRHNVASFGSDTSISPTPQRAAARPHRGRASILPRRSIAARQNCCSKRSRAAPRTDALYTDLFQLIGWQFTWTGTPRIAPVHGRPIRTGSQLRRRPLICNPTSRTTGICWSPAHSAVGLSISYWEEADAPWRARARAALRAATDASRKSIEKDPELPKLRGYFEEIAASHAAAAELMEKDSLRDDAARAYVEACAALDHAAALTVGTTAKSKDTDEMRALRQRCFSQPAIECPTGD